MLLFVLSLCGLASAMSGRIVDPVVIEIAADLAAPVGRVAKAIYFRPIGVSVPLTSVRRLLSIWLLPYE